MDYLKLFESLSILIASIIALIGVFTWRRETRWKRKYELAEETLCRFYEAHQNIRTIRSPFGFAGEGKTRKRAENESAKESDIYDRAYIINERFERNKEALEKLQVLKFRFITVFGKDHEYCFDNLIKSVNKIFLAANEIARIQLGEYGLMTPEKKGKEIRKNYKIIYSTPKEEDDPIEQDLSDTIKAIEKTCRKIIGQK